MVQQSSNTPKDQIRLYSRESGRIIVYLPYKADRVAKIKTIPGRRWDSRNKYWTVPHTEDMIEKLQALFEGEPVYIDTDLRPSKSNGPEPQPVSDTIRETLEAVENEFKLRRYRFSTRKAYRPHIRRFLQSLEKPPRDATTEEIYAYFVKLVDRDLMSYSYHNQAISAIQFLYTYVLEKPHLIAKIPRPRPEKKLPVVLSRESVTRLLNSVQNIKHLALLLLVYSGGLRVSEAVRLQVEDLDAERRLMRVRMDKGRKDRYTISLAGGAARR